MLNNIPRPIFESLGDINTKNKLASTIINVAPTITEQDIQRRVKTRYFAKYTSQRNGTIYEITGGIYSNILTNALYRKTSIDWIICGKLEDTVLTLPSG